MGVSSPTRIANRLSTPTLPGTDWHVDGALGNDGFSGLEPDKAKATVGAALALATAGDRIWLHSPPTDTVGVTIPRTKPRISLIATKRCGLAPSAANSLALTVHADDVTLMGIGGEGKGTGGGLLYSGKRLHALSCKFEGGAQAIRAYCGTAAEQLAGTHGDASDAIFEDVEWAWSDEGFLLKGGVGADPVTQTVIKNCRSHNIAGRHIYDDGIHAVNLQVLDHVWERDESGALPTAYVEVDEAASNGIIMGHADCDHDESMVTLGAGVKSHVQFNDDFQTPA